MIPQTFDENTLLVMTLGTEILMETIYTSSTKVDTGGGKKTLFGPFVWSAWDVMQKKPTGVSGFGSFGSVFELASSDDSWQSSLLSVTHEKVSWHD